MNNALYLFGPVYFLWGVLCVSGYKHSKYYIKTPRSLSVAIRIGILFLYPILMVCGFSYFTLTILKDLFYDE
jgi:hypothetical protein